MKLIYLNSALKSNFYVTVGIKILFFRVSVTIEPCHSVVYLNTFLKHIKPLQVLQNRTLRIIGNFLHRPSKLENVLET